MSDTKHGWVTPRADGARARCGGPGICTTCNTEAMHEKMLTGLFGAPAAAPHRAPAEREAVDTDSFDDPSALAAAADALSGDTSNDNAQFAAAYLYRQAKALAAPPAPSCSTCNDQGAVGNILTAQPCPDCAAPGVSTVEDAQDGVTVLPDGSACALASFPLPATHWLYAEREYAPGAEEPKELPAPILTHAQRDAVVAAIRYAVRGATMCGKEQDFDPDALVQNAVYALCGPYGPAVAAPAAGDALDAARYRWLCDKFGITKLPCAIERIIEGSYVADGKAAIDAAIDAAIAAQRKGDA